MHTQRRAGCPPKLCAAADLGGSLDAQHQESGQVDFDAVTLDCSATKVYDINVEQLRQIFSFKKNPQRNA